MLAVLSAVGILYALEVREFFQEESYLSISFEGCPQCVFSSSSVVLSGLLAVNTADRTRPRRGVSFTQLEVSFEKSDKIRDLGILRGWYNGCQKIVVETNYDANSVEVLSKSGTEFSSIGSFLRLRRGVFELVPPIKDGTDVSLHLKVSHSDLLTSLGPATDVLDFEIDVEFVGHSGFDRESSVWFLDVVIDKSGELESSDVTRGNVRRRADGRSNWRSRDPREKFAERLNTSDVSDLIYFDFQTGSGKIRLQYVRGLMTQQLLLVVCSIVFGAGVSAILEAFLALSVLRYRVRREISEVAERRLRLP